MMWIWEKLVFWFVGWLRNDSVWDNDIEDVRRKCLVGFDELIIRDV